jgi:hypothetical protein
MASKLKINSEFLTAEGSTNVEETGEVEEAEETEEVGAPFCTSWLWLIRGGVGSFPIPDLHFSAQLNSKAIPPY